MSKLSQILIKNLELKEKEVGIFLLLFFHSFFIGWFIAFYFVSANSVFIVHYGSEQLPYAYIIAGIAGYLLSSLYSFLQKRLSTFWLFFSALFFMLIISTAGRLGLGHINEKILSIFVFIWAWPFISLSAIELGGLSLRFLNLIQVKRLYGLFNMGGVLAAILSYFAVPAIKPYLTHIYDLLYIGIAGLIISIFILLILYKKYGKEEQQINLSIFKNEGKKPKTSFRELIKEKYFRWIFISATLSMTMIYLTDFGFLSSVKVEIPPQYVPHYLGFVFGALKIGELIISYYSRRLLSNYGVRIGLTILPIVSASLIFIASLVGITFGAGILLLIIMTLLKSLERILRRGLDDPAFNILYQPLPEEKKLAVQTRVGVVMQLSIAFAGILLWLINRALSKPQGFLLQYYPLFFLPILLFWVFVAKKLYLSYKEKIRQILADISKDKRRGTDFYQYGTEILRKRLKDQNKQIALFAATILSEMNPKALDAYATHLLKTAQSPILIKTVLKNLDPTWRRRLAKVIDEVRQKKLTPDVERLTYYAQKNLDYSKVKPFSPQEIQTLLNSPKVDDRLLLIKAIHKRLIKAEKQIILKLLDDENKIVKIGAINIAHLLPDEDIINKMTELLQNKEYRHIVANALLDFGGKILPYLKKFFNEENPNIDLILKIIEIYAKIGTKDAQEELINKIEYPHRTVQIAVLFALFFCKFQADERHINIIKRKMEEIIENILWIYATSLDIEDKHNTLKLYLALDLEKELNFELLFILLSFLYEPRIITLIQKNIIGKDTIFAIEIMDNFFDQDIKRLITPLFDDITPQQKIKRLQHLFPQKQMTLTERLKDIIMRDFNKIDPWTIAKAVELLGKLYRKEHAQKRKRLNLLDYSDIKIWTKEKLIKTLEKIKKSDMPDEIFLALFHTEEIVYTTAAKILFNENPIKCFDFLANMSEKKQKLMTKLANNEPLIDDIIRLLKRYSLFFNVPENILTNFAKKVNFTKLAKDQYINIFQKNGKENVIMIIKGTIAFITENSEKIFTKNDIIIRGINIDEFANKLYAKKESILLTINRIDFFDALIADKDLIRHILQIPSDNFGF